MILRGSEPIAIGCRSVRRPELFLAGPDGSVDNGTHFVERSTRADAERA
jgi:hypothetical protein